MISLYEIQSNWIETGKKIIPILKKIKALGDSDKCELFYANKQMILSYIKSFYESVQLFGYEQYYELAKGIYYMSDQIDNKNKEEIDGKEIDTIFEAALVIGCKIIEERKGTGKKCTCCGNQVYYRPLPLYYKEQEKRYNSVSSVSEFLNEKEYSCPVCGASDRDRMIIDFMKKLELQDGDYDESLLQIAPSQAIEHWINSNCPALNYDSADLYMDHVDYMIDVQNMKEIADEAYDMIICSHVLEHVKDDIKAMRELYRILKPDGFCMFLVPVDLSKDDIEEEWGLSEDENWRRFGQGDHCRRYSKNGLIERLKNVGFNVHNLNADFFGKEIFAQGAYTQSSVLYVLTKEAGTIKEQIEKKIKSRQEYVSEMPLVSVIMSSYNHEKYVAEAIESVLNQTYKNIEFLVVDDASSDRTANIIKKYEDRLEKVTYLSQNTRGRGILDLADQATGKYVALINSDDIWEKDKIRKQVIYLTHHKKCAVCFTGACSIDENGKIGAELFERRNYSRSEWMNYFFYNDNCLCHPSVLAKRDIYVNLLHDPKLVNYRQLPDYYMWLKLIQHYSFFVIEKDLVYFRIHPHSLNENVSAASEKNIIRHCNEEMHIWLTVIENMEKDFFIKTFHIHDEIEDEEDLKCQKYFALKNHGSAYMKMAALMYFYQVSNEDMLKLLDEKYNYSQNDLFELAASIYVIEAKKGLQE